MAESSLTLLFLLSLAASTCAEKWGNVEKLLNGGEREFHSLVDPLAQMTLYSYISTNGSYYREFSKGLKILDFDMDKELSQDPPIGVRARVFVGAQDSDPVVIAFRGSDISMRSDGSLADLCFDTMLLNSEYGGIKPATFCSNFEQHMDYFSQAKKIVQNTFDKYKMRRVFLTGHSLGCALSGMMSALFEDRVTGVCFSCPGILKFTANRTETKLDELKSISNFYTLAEAQDPITLSGVLSGGDIGKKYLWSSPALTTCSTCCHEMSNGTQINVFTDEFCIKCFEERHEFHELYKHTIVTPNVKAHFAKDNEQILNCDKKGVSKVEGGEVAMVILLIVVICASLVGMVSATVAYRSKKTSFSKYMELEQPRR